MTQSVNSFSGQFINRLINKANESKLNYKLAAVLLKNTNQVGPILCNSECMYKRGKICPSLHAEARVLFEKFRSSLVISRGKWRLLREKSKVS